MTEGTRPFGDMSRREHAYALGAVAAAGRVREGALEVRLRGDGEPLLALLRQRDKADTSTLHEVREGRARLAGSVADVAARWLGAAPGDKESLRFPSLPPELLSAFARGVFDAAARISSPRRTGELTVRLDRPGEAFTEGLLAHLTVRPDHVGEDTLQWNGVTALDLLGRLYDECAAAPRGAGHETSAQDELPPHRRKHLARYLRWAQRVPELGADDAPPANIRWTPVHPDARAPFKERVSDSGYDLTLLYEKKRVGACILYGTGVVIEPPFGWYLDVVPRSSIIKTGYLLANNVGVIDRGYRGEVLVPLLKIDPNAPDLPLPARVVQMVPRPIAHFGVTRTDGVRTTHRGAGGFGSTG